MNSIAICPHCYRPIRDFDLTPRTDRAGQYAGEEFTYKCPSCNLYITNPWHIDASQQLVWVNDSRPMPNTCVTCGMFTDRRIKLKGSAERQGKKEEGITSWLQVLGCLAGIFLGSIYSLVAYLLFSGDSDGEGAHSVNVIVKVPQCNLCSALQKPKPLTASAEPKQLLIAAHQAFVDRWNASEPVQPHP